VQSNGRQKITDTIIAFDILPMSSSRKESGIRVAASALFSNGERKEWSQLSRKKLIKIVHKIDAKYLGTDNPMEILMNGESIGSFCQRLPVQCNFVHANLTSTGTTVSLRKLLMDYKLTSSGKKLSPLLTARALVQLIQLGVGMKLEPFEKETIIEIGRPRSTGKGGWSQARFERQGEEIIARASKLVRTTLEQSKLPFDEITRTTKYGAKSSRFHVFSHKMLVDAKLKPLSLYPAKVKVWSPKKRVVTHGYLTDHDQTHKAQFYSHLQRLVVGIDPGMTTGVAIVDLRGHVVTVFSRKNLSKGELVSELSNYGIPVIICSDVYPVPTFVSKLAATYNADVAYPSSQLSQDEKRQLANSTQVDQRLDSHGRDALAAAISHYRKLEPNFKKLESKDLSYKELDLAKGLLIRGLSIVDSVAAVTMLRKEKIEPQIVQAQQVSEQSEHLGRLYNLLSEMAMSEETITNLRAHTGRLEAKLLQFEMRNKHLAWELSQARNEIILELLNTELLEEKDLEIKMLKRSLNEEIAENSNLSKINTSLEQLIWISLEEGGLPIKVLPIFSQDAIYQLKRDRELNEGDIILILDPTGGGPQTAISLAETKPRMIFLYGNDLTDQAMHVLQNNDIPVIRSESYDIRRIGDLAIINTSNFDTAMGDYQEQKKKWKAIEKRTKIDLTINNFMYEREQTILKTQKSYDDYEPEEDEEAEI
jgi:predicted RNase H-like nuclease (RuvC/YqgF family)